MLKELQKLGFKKVKNASYKCYDYVLSFGGYEIICIETGKNAKTVAFIENGKKFVFMSEHGKLFKLDELFNIVFDFGRRSLAGEIAEKCKKYEND